MRFVERQFDANGMRLNYVEGENTGRPLLMLHGATGSWQDLETIFPHLAETSHIYALDLRGHGQSGRASGNYRATDYVPDVIEFIRGCIQQPAVVFGFSLGGIVALKAAAHHPEAIQALILEDPALVEFTHRPEDIFAHPYFKGAFELLRRHPSQDDIAAWLKSLDPETPDNALEIHASRLAKLDPEMLIPILGGELVEKHSLGEALQKITCPILLLQADPALGAATEDQHVAVFREFAPQTQVVSIAGARHGIHRTHMPDLIEPIKSFLAGLD